MPVPLRLRRWLTGPESDPSVRARFWLEVEGVSPRDPRVQDAARSIGRQGWAASLLNQQLSKGQWVTPGTSPSDLYRPKFTVTNWIAIVLADLGMTKRDPRIRRTAELLIDRWGVRDGDLGGHGGEICVTGNAVRTLIRFGFLEHPVVQHSIAWIVREQKSDGGWHCFPSRSGTLDGWEGLAALAEIPEDARDSSVARAIDRGSEFYLKRHLMEESGPRYAPWFRIHYPNHYYYDILVGLRILTRLGRGSDPRMSRAIRWLRDAQRPDGTWALDAAHPDLDPKRSSRASNEASWPGDSDIVCPVMLEPLHQPSRWATVEALSVLARAR